MSPRATGQPSTLAKEGERAYLRPVLPAIRSLRGLDHVLLQLLRTTEKVSGWVHRWSNDCCHGLFASAATHKRVVMMVTMTVMMILVEVDLYVQGLKESCKDLEFVVNVCFWSRARLGQPYTSAVSYDR